VGRLFADFNRSDDLRPIDGNSFLERIDTSMYHGDTAMDQSVISRSAPHAPAVARRRRGHGHPWLALLAVSLGLMMVMLDATVVAIANPAIGRDLDASLSGLQWVTNAYLLAVAVLIVTAGKAGDRFGRKRVFIAGVVGFAAASAACGLAPTIGALIAFRAVQGLAGALLMPSTLAIVRATFPERLLQQAIGIWAGVSAVAVASGPIVAGMVVEHASWRWVFYLNVPVALFAVAVGGWVIAESRDEGARGEKLDLAGMMILCASLFALVWGIIKSQTLGWGGVATVSSLAAAAVGLGLFALRERETQHPLLPLAIMRNLSLSAGIVLVLLLSFALFGITFFLSLYLQRVRAFSPVETGVRTLPLTATLVLAAPLGGVLSARFGPRIPLAGGMAMIGIGMLGLSGLSPHTGYGYIWPWLLALGLALGLVLTAATQIVVENAPVRMAGLAGGLQQTALQIGGALGTSVLGAVVAGRVTATFFGKLISSGIPVEAAEEIARNHGAVAQGVAPIGSAMPVGLQIGVVRASFDSFTYALDVAFIVAAVISFAAALLAALAVSGKQERG
jgi:EmrB/QacA subfamily drug resistance transporter